MDRLKIAVIGSRGIPSNYGGFETFAEEISPRLVDLGFDVTVYGRSNNIKYESPFYKGVRLKILPTISHKYLDTVVHTFLSVLHAYFFEKFDVVLMVNAANAPFSSIFKLSNTRVVLNVDGIERLRKKWGRIGKLYYRFGEWAATIIPDEIICDAEAIERYYKETYNVKSNVITYGANTEIEPANETLERLELTSDNYMLYVTRLEPENNADLVIRAYAQVNSDMPLVIVGDAPYSDAYKRCLVELARHDDRVKLPGAIYGTGYRELISNAFMYIQAAEVGGTHPALIESMAVGNCIVANDVIEHLEVLDGAGIIYKKNDEGDLSGKIQLVLGNENLRQEKKAAARARIQDAYTWGTITHQYAELFERVAQIDSRPTPNN